MKSFTLWLLEIGTVFYPDLTERGQGGGGGGEGGGGGAIGFRERGCSGYYAPVQVYLETSRSTGGGCAVLPCSRASIGRLHSQTSIDFTIVNGSMLFSFISGLWFSRSVKAATVSSAGLGKLRQEDVAVEGCIHRVPSLLSVFIRLFFVFF